MMCRLLTSLSILSSSACATWGGTTALGVRWTGPIGSCGDAESSVDCSDDIDKVVAATARSLSPVVGRRVTPEELAERVSLIEFSNHRVFCFTCGNGHVWVGDMMQHLSFKGLLALAEDGYVIRLHRQGCLANTSLAHELSHMAMELWVKGNPDHHHTDQRVWGPAGTVRRANDAADLQVCD